MAETNGSTAAQLILKYVNEIRSRVGDDFNFENALASARENTAATTEEKARGYLALRFALWDYFRKVGAGTTSSLWDAFFIRLRNYSKISKDIFCVTTNYDLIIEKALSRHWTGSGYENAWEVLHPHGSIEHALECTDSTIQVEAFPYPVANNRTTQQRKYEAAYKRYRTTVIPAAAYTDQWQVLSKSPIPVGVNPLRTLGFDKPSETIGPQVRIPALEMPVYENKSPNLWTQTMQSKVSQKLKTAAYVIVVGWAATDTHISSVVKDALAENQSAEVQIMCAKGSQDVAERLGIDMQRAVIPNDGVFSKTYLDTTEFTDMVGPIA